MHHFVKRTNIFVFIKELLCRKKCVISMIRLFILVGSVLCLWMLSSFSIRMGVTKSGFIHKNEAPSSSEAEHIFNVHVDDLYKSCHLIDSKLKKELFKKALVGYYNIKQSNNSVRPIISIIDFVKPSTEKRLWVIDVKAKKLLFYTLVAHGKNSGENFSVNFSNIPDSYMSSLGFFLTGNTYMGKHGLSLVIEGLDHDNCNAKARSIVIHGAEYVSQEFINCTGRLGRSHGCPAVPLSQHKEIIDAIQGGSVLFIHHGGKKYQSEWLNKEKAVRNYSSEAYVKS